METVSLTDLFGIWISIFLTLAIFSFLFDDNPIYKLAENLFLGISIGIGTIEIYYGVFKPNLIDHLVDLRWQSFIPLGLLFLLMMKVTKKYSYFARLPIAFIVAAFAGVKLTGEANANLMTPIAGSMPDLQASWAQYGFWSWENAGAGVVSDIILVLGLSACLLHFYFSAKPNRAMSGVSKVGITVLMLSFGASFGYTVMGRISLAIGRFQELLGLDKTEALWAIEGSDEPLSTMTNVSIIRWMTVVTAVVIILIIARWKRQQNNEPTDQAG